MLTGHFIFHYAASPIFVHPYIPYNFEFMKDKVNEYLCIG